MKKIKILGIITIIILVFIIAAFALLAAFGFLRFEKDPDGTGSHIIFTPVEEQKGWRIPEENNISAVIKTELGDITLRLANCPAAKEFIALDNMGSFEGAAFSTLAENMFIQAKVNSPAFKTEQTSFACIYGAVGFVAEGENTAPSFFIVTNSDLSGISEAYMTENGFDKDKIALYKELGGMPEYEGKTVVFAEVSSGMDVAEKIAKAENSGYTGGYSAAEPVKILSIEIVYPTEAN